MSYKSFCIQNIQKFEMFRSFSVSGSRRGSSKSLSSCSRVKYLQLNSRKTGGNQVLQTHVRKLMKMAKQLKKRILTHQHSQTQLKIQQLKKQRLRNQLDMRFLSRISRQCRGAFDSFRQKSLKLVPRARVTVRLQDP